MNHNFIIFDSKSISIIIAKCEFDHRIFQVDHRHKWIRALKEKLLFSVKLHLKSVIYIDASGCNDIGSLEACI